MKKILITLLCMCLITGCSKKEELSLNIPKWMTTGKMSKNEYIQILGIGYEGEDKENGFNYLWDNYELIKGYKGTLRLETYGDYMISWSWTLSANEKDYNKICDIIKVSLGDPTSHEDDENESYTFKFIQDQKYEQVNHALGVFYRNDIITITWFYNNYPEEDET